MQYNVQGLNGKLVELERILVEHKVDILCLSEHWELEEMTDFGFGDYVIICCYCRKQTTRGGVAIVAR